MPHRSSSISSSAAAVRIPLLLLLLLLPCLVNAAPTDATIALCPVIQYATDVHELTAHDLSQLPLTALESHSLPSVAAGAKKAYAVVLQPTSYAHNSSTPKVEWVDLHYRIGSAGVQENVQMKAVTRLMSSVSMPTVTSQPQMDANMMTSVNLNSAQARMEMTHVQQASAAFVFSPIFLSPTDQLFYSHTICSNTIDCESQTHSFCPTQPMQQPQQQPITQQNQQDSSDLSSLKLAHTLVPQKSVCPAVNFTSRVHCTDFSCKLSFINLTPSISIHWVDAHVTSNSSSFAHAVGQSSLSISQMARENFRMAFVGGAVSVDAHTRMEMAQSALMAAQLTSPTSISAFGAESAPDTLLNSTSGSQVFQFMVPLGFRNGDMIGISYTYCADGTDCDTEVQMYKLREEVNQSPIQKPTKVAAANPDSISHQLLQQPLPIKVPAGYTIRITQQQSSKAFMPSDNIVPANSKQLSQPVGRIEQTQLQNAQL